MKRLMFIALSTLGGMFLLFSSTGPTRDLATSIASDQRQQSVPQPTQVNFERIFTHHLDEPEQENRVTLMVTGDVLPARMVNFLTVTKQDFTWPYHHTAERLRQAEITFINLETPLVDGCTPTQQGMVFCGDPRNTVGLQFAGVDVASLANNHALNQGKEGFFETIEHLQQAGIQSVGTHTQPVILERNGVRFAFLAYNDVGAVSDIMASATEERLQYEIAEARERAEVVIVQFHWGEEYRRDPTVRQQEKAHLAIELGADLVLGNHPHWFQSLEMYKGKLIAYSHGNFVFDQMWSMETRQGVVGEYVFEGDTLVDVIYHPLQIEEYGQPRWMEGEERTSVLQELERITRQ